LHRSSQMQWNRGVSFMNSQLRLCMGRSKKVITWWSSIHTYCIRNIEAVPAVESLFVRFSLNRVVQLNLLSYTLSKIKILIPSVLTYYFFTFWDFNNLWTYWKCDSTTRQTLWNFRNCCQNLRFHKSWGLICGTLDMFYKACETHTAFYVIALAYLVDYSHLYAS
jgi:hypothetical protein